jgi:hypothetical protein
MMTASVMLPPIIGPIMIPVFVDLGLDIGDSNNRFPGVYLQVFTNTHICQIWWIKTMLFFANKDSGYKFISFKRNYFHKHEKCLCKDPVPNFWIFDSYLQESPSAIVGNETWGDRATKIVVLY